MLIAQEQAGQSAEAKVYDRKQPGWEQTRTAACYALLVLRYTWVTDVATLHVLDALIALIWPEEWLPGSVQPKEALVKAGALLAAEIDRLLEKEQEEA